MIALARARLVSLLLLATGASAEGLKLPDNLTDLRSPQGEAYLLETHALEAYFPISAFSRPRERNPIAASPAWSWR